MSTLYCKTHGEEKEREAIADNNAMHLSGESILIVKGRLRTGPWLCDRCNAELKQGDEAVFQAVFPRSVTESIFQYDFSYEHDYFALSSEDELIVYGAPWPGGSPAELLEIAREQGLLEDDFLAEYGEEADA